MAIEVQPTPEEIAAMASTSGMQEPLKPEGEWKEEEGSQSKTEPLKTEPPKPSIFPENPKAKVKPKQEAKPKAEKESPSPAKQPTVHGAPKKEEAAKKSDKKSEGKSNNLFDEDELAAQLEKELSATPEEIAAQASEQNEGAQKKEVSKEVKPVLNTKLIEEKTGIKAKDEDELIAKINEIKSSKAPKVDTNKLREIKSSITNLKQALTLDAETLVKNELVWGGMTEADAEEQIADMSEVNPKSIEIKAREIKSGLNKALNHYDSEYEKILNTPQEESNQGESDTKDIVSFIDKQSNVFGYEVEGLDDIKNEIKAINAKSLYDILPKDQLAEAIIGYKMRENVLKEVGRQSYKKGFQKAWDTQVNGKILNKQPASGNQPGRQFMSRNSAGSKPDSTKFVSGIAAGGQ